MESCPYCSNLSNTRSTFTFLRRAALIVRRERFKNVKVQLANGAFPRETNISHARTRDSSVGIRTRLRDRGHFWKGTPTPPGSSPPPNADVKNTWRYTSTRCHGAKLNVEATLLSIDVRKCLSFTRLIHVQNNNKLNCESIANLNCSDVRHSSPGTILRLQKHVPMGSGEGASTFVNFRRLSFEKAVT